MTLRDRDNAPDAARAAALVGDERREADVAPSMRIARGADRAPGARDPRLAHVAPALRAAHALAAYGLNAVLSALLAPPCAVCGAVLDAPLGGAACDRCWARLPVFASGARTIVGDRASALDARTALGPFEGVMRDVLHALKYDGRRSLARPLAARIAEAGADVLRGASAIVPVPLHHRRRRARGFNQAALLAGHLAAPLGLPVVAALRRVRATAPQAELTAAARARNVRDAFAPARWPWARPSRCGSVVVLVDDVETTGATLEACARVLREAGVAEVRALTAARALIRRP